VNSGSGNRPLGTETLSFLLHCILQRVTNTQLLMIVKIIPITELDTLLCPFAFVDSEISASPMNDVGGPRPTTASSTATTANRIRTVLTEYQLRVLRTCYAVSPRPDAATRDQLIEMTGLSARVIRVWFQNKRCKDKKRSVTRRVSSQRPASMQARFTDTGLCVTPSTD